VLNRRQVLEIVIKSQSEVPYPLLPNSDEKSTYENDSHGLYAQWSGRTTVAPGRIGPDHCAYNPLHNVRMRMMSRILSSIQSQGCGPAL
jgi:hypothetical protein